MDKEATPPLEIEEAVSSDLKDSRKSGILYKDFTQGRLGAGKTAVYDTVWRNYERKSQSGSKRDF